MRRAAGAGAWSSNGTIVFAGDPRSPLSQIAADGDVVRPATTFDREQGATGHNWPQFLPDGRHYLFYQISFKPEHQGIYVASLDSGETTRIVASTGAGLYASGYLLFVRDGILLAQAFDDRALRRKAKPCKSPIASATSARRLAISPSPCHRPVCSPTDRAWR